MEVEDSCKVAWKRFECKAAPAVDGHCSCVVNDEIYIFGGVVHTKDDFREVNTMCVASADQSFYVLDVNGEIPMSRSNATMAAVDKKIYLFGGLSSKCGWLDDLHVFDTDAKTWQKLKTVGPKPSSRDKVVSAVIDNRIYIFGGFGPLNPIQVEKALRCGGSSDEDGSSSDDDDEEDDDDDRAATFGWFNDLYVLDTATATWFCLPLTSSFGPTPRAACSMCAVGRSVFVFGGRDKKGRCNDLFKYDTRLSSWVKVEPPRGSVPRPRSFHASVSAGGFVVVVGGISEEDKHLDDVHIYDPEKSLWTERKHEGGFAARGNFALNVVKDRLVAFGGSADFCRKSSQCRTFFGDFFVLPLDQLLGDLK